jgi:hypothetical protein
LLALLGFSGEALCTPDAATWTREVLLGANGSHYFVWVARWSQPGSHHESSASVSIRKVRLSDFVVEQEAEVYSASYVFEDTTEFSRPPFDLSVYLRENRVAPTFAAEGPMQVAVRDSTLELVVGEAHGILLTAKELRDQLRRRLDPIEDEPRVVGRYDAEGGDGGSPSYSFYSLVLGGRAYDGNWSEVLVVVSEGQDRRAWEQVEAVEDGSEDGE